VCASRWCWWSRAVGRDERGGAPQDAAERQRFFARSGARSGLTVVGSFSPPFASRAASERFVSCSTAGAARAALSRPVARCSLGGAKESEGARCGVRLGRYGLRHRSCCAPSRRLPLRGAARDASERLRFFARSAAASSIPAGRRGKRRSRRSRVLEGVSRTSAAGRRGKKCAGASVPVRLTEHEHAVRQSTVGPGPRGWRAAGSVAGRCWGCVVARGARNSAR
jgi:hypothetical protein